MIYILIAYFGKFPNYFQLYLDSLGINNDILHVLFMTDIDHSTYVLPPNVSFIHMTLDDVRLRAKTFLSKNYKVDVNANELIKRNYKLCDYKIIYHCLFEDKLTITNDDYVGWGDCDLIYGKLSNFIDLKENYDFMGQQGHFTVFKYVDDYKNLYKNIKNLDKLLIDDIHYATDEKQYRDELLLYIDKHKLKIFKMHNYFCDIKPWQWMPNLSKELTMAGCPDRIIKYIVFFKHVQKLFAVYRDERCIEVSYAHLQKRDMKILFEKYENIFYVKKETFELTALPN